MFKVAIDTRSTGANKITIAGNILESAWDEINAIADESGMSLSGVVGQMLYECLGRDKITGLLKEKV